VDEKMDALPKSTQEQIVQHLQECALDLQDEERWNEQFRRTQSQLVAAAQRARGEIAAGRAEPLDLRRL
jgi:hypothetical protein